MVSLRNFPNESHTWMNEWMLYQIIRRQRREAIPPEQTGLALFRGQIIPAARLENVTFKSMRDVFKWEGDARPYYIHRDVMFCLWMVSTVHENSSFVEGMYVSF